MIRFILCFVFLASVIGCQSDEAITKNVDLQKIDNLKSLDARESRVAVNLLNSYERQYLFDRHFQEVLDNNKSLSETQQGLILELKNLNVESLHRAPATKDSRVSQIEREWTAKATQVFSKEDILTIAYGFTKTKLNMAAAMKPTPTPNYILPDCACNIGSIWSCDMYTECKGDVSTCRPSSSGCGFLTIYTCDGLCKLIMT